MIRVVAVLVAAVLSLAGTAAAQPQARGRGGEDKSQPVTVDADKMERFGKESLVVFTGNVVARQNNSVQYADRMEVYLDEKGDRILRTISTGSVRIITRDCRTGTAKRAEYYELEQRVVLLGNARVWQDDNVVSGENAPFNSISMSQSCRMFMSHDGKSRARAFSCFTPASSRYRFFNTPPWGSVNAPIRFTPL